MNNAIERLAAQLMKLSDDEWTKVTERYAAGQGWDAVFGAAWEEISERLADVDASMRSAAFGESRIAPEAGGNAQEGA